MVTKLLPARARRRVTASSDRLGTAAPLRLAAAHPGLPKLAQLPRVCARRKVCKLEEGVQTPLIGRSACRRSPASGGNRRESRPGGVSSGMNRMIFVNLPVADLELAKSFYTGLGFSV